MSWKRDYDLTTLRAELEKDLPAKRRAYLESIVRYMEQLVAQADALGLPRHVGERRNWVSLTDWIERLERENAERMAVLGRAGSRAGANARRSFGV